MKKPIFIVILYIFCGFILFSNPKINVDPSIIDFGEQKSGTSVSGHFTVKNTGTDLLDVKIKTTCGCTSVSKNDLSILEGKSAEIDFEIKTTAQYSGGTSNNIIVESNDRTKPIIYVVIKGILTNYDSVKVNEIEPKINYLTDFEKKSINDKNILAIFSYKNCLECRPIIKSLIYWVYKMNGKITINYYNLEEDKNKKTILLVRKELGFYPDLPVAAYNGNYFCGKREIFSLINGSYIPERPKKNMASNFSVPAVILAGLLDGINPCAFTVIILLLSYLTIQLRSVRSILFSGIFYISSVFVTYYLVGFGLFHFIKKITVFPVISISFKYLLAAALFVLAFISLLDFIKAKKGKNNEMILKLPAFLQNAIRKNIRLQMKDYKIFISSIMLGFIVSLIELVCTGQVYLPVIGLMVQNESQRISGMLFLLLYNFAFIIPLVAVFLLVFFGISSNRIGLVFSKNIALVKLLFVFLFLLFGMIIIYTLIF
jgi:hypothetical protein